MLVSRPCPFFHQVPLVHHEDRSASRLDGDSGDPRVLTHHPGHRIEQDKGHIGALHGLDGPEDTVILDPMAHPALGANPRRVHQHISLSLVRKGGIKDSDMCWWTR